MNQRGVRPHRTLWRIVLLSTFVVAAVAATIGPASATTGWGGQSSVTAQVVKAAPVAVPMTTNATLDNCPMFDFCAFSQPSFQGTRTIASACNVKVGITFTGVGSWVNNQSPPPSPTQAKLLDSAGHTILVTANPPSALAHFDWLDIFTVIPCQ